MEAVAEGLGVAGPERQGLQRSGGRRRGDMGHRREEGRPHWARCLRSPILQTSPLGTNKSTGRSASPCWSLAPRLLGAAGRGPRDTKGPASIPIFENQNHSTAQHGAHKQRRDMVVRAQTSRATCQVGKCSKGLPVCSAGWRSGCGRGPCSKRQGCCVTPVTRAISRPAWRTEVGVRYERARASRAGAAGEGGRGVRRHTASCCLTVERGFREAEG